MTDARQLASFLAKFSDKIQASKTQPVEVTQLMPFATTFQELRSALTSQQKQIEMLKGEVASLKEQLNRRQEKCLCCIEKEREEGKDGEVKSFEYASTQKLLFNPDQSLYDEQSDLLSTNRKRTHSMELDESNIIVPDSEGEDESPSSPHNETIASTNPPSSLQGLVVYILRVNGVTSEPGMTTNALASEFQTTQAHTVRSTNSSSIHRIRTHLWKYLDLQTSQQSRLRARASKANHPIPKYRSFHLYLPTATHSNDSKAPAPAPPSQTSSPTPATSLISPTVLSSPISPHATRQLKVQLHRYSHTTLHPHHTKRPLYHLLAHLVRQKSLKFDTYEESDIRSLLAKSFQSSSLFPQTLLDYTSMFRQNGSDHLPKRLRDETLLTAGVQEHKERCEAVAAILVPRFREGFEVFETGEGGRIDLGVVCKEVGLICHYLEYSQSKTEGLTFTYSCMTETLTQDEYESMKKIVKDISGLEFSDVKNQFVLVSDGSGVGYNLVAVDGGALIHSGGAVKVAVKAVLLEKGVECFEEDAFQLGYFHAEGGKSCDVDVLRFCRGGN
ncbi:hypothetical protein HK097_008563 [Rhizophlyctis rosea]|uniref:Uncharacterized protein n=1 Tax=Rhizophlyctis rosea TaxID=64517 RepID=A0AAD5SA52_9FUNG|nr:hypothetical protein HK097_008563 [Rhizophlyctis rosea]